MSEEMKARILPIEPPYSPEVGESLRKWMPPGSAMEPLKLFRTLMRHPMLGDRMRPLGAAFLGHGTIPMRARELLILRTCARCGAEYEWGVHVTAFAEAAGLDDAAVKRTTRREIEEIAEIAEIDEDALLLRFADEMHDTQTVSDALWEKLAARFTEAQRLEMIAIAGFYHLISFIVNGARIEREAWGARFPKA